MGSLSFHKTTQQAKPVTFLDILLEYVQLIICAMALSFSEYEAYPWYKKSNKTLLLQVAVRCLRPIGQNHPAS